MGLALKVYGGKSTLRLARFILVMFGIRTEVISVHSNVSPATKVIFTIGAPSSIS